MQKLRLNIDTSPLEALESKFDGLVAVMEKKNAIIRRVCVQVTPVVRRHLLNALYKSGLHLSGYKQHRNKEDVPLEQLVAMAVVYPTTKGITIGPARNQTPEMYKKMGALEFGYIRGLTVKNRRARKKIKEAALKAGGGGVVKAHPYFHLPDAGFGDIEKAINAAIQAEVNKVMAGGKP